MTGPASTASRGRGIELACLAIAALVVAIAVARPVESGAPEAGEKDASAGALSPAWLLPVDDAYIFVRFAQQAARGRPMQWTNGELSTGSTSFLFPWLLVPGQWLFDDLAGWSAWSRWIGACSLFLCGAAATWLLRALALGRPWPLVGGLMVTFSGPLAYGSLSGMESGLNAAAILGAVAACTSLSKVDGTGASRAIVVTTLLSLAVLPWLRPENVILTLLGATAMAVGVRPAVRPRHAALTLVPACLPMLLYGFAAGQPLGAGSVAKSVLATPYADMALMGRLVALNYQIVLVPLYIGLRSHILAPGLGYLALVGALVAFPSREARLRPLAITWATLLLLAPLSTHLGWQFIRHHHGGIACAIVLSTATLAIGVQRFAPRLRWLALVLPLAMAADLAYWRDEYVRGVRQLHNRHDAAVTWLRHNARDRTLLVNDAGLPALAHDGPMVDVIGLGTPTLALPHRHGAGTVVEALARRPAVPSVAAANLDVVRVASILGPRLIAGLDEQTQTVVAPVRQDLLTHTVLEADGIDLAHLESEHGARLHWAPQPPPLGSSFALVLEDATGPTAQGCRPLRGLLTLEVPHGRPLWLRAATLGEAAASLLTGVGVTPEAEIPRRHSVPPGLWSTLELGASASGRLHVMAQPGFAACLEAVAWGPLPPNPAKAGTN